MEHKEPGKHPGIPRASRLPLPRTTISKAPSDSYQNASHRSSQLPKPSAVGSLRLKTKAPLAPTVNGSQTPGDESINHRAIHDLSASCVGQISDSNALETTPPNRTRLIYVDGDENSTTNGLDTERQKRKPRPSLSERTLETLSQIPPSPSPSPSRGQSNIANSNLMGPPSRSIPSLRAPRSRASLRERSLSPSKESPLSMDRNATPVKSLKSRLSTANTGRINNPTGTPAREARPTMSKPLYSSPRPGSAANQYEARKVSNPKPVSAVHKARSLYDLKNTDQNKLAANAPSRLASTGLSGAGRSNVPGSARSISSKGTSNSTAKLESTRPSAPTPLTPTRPTKALPRKSVGPLQKQSLPYSNTKPSAPPKSSMALRETIAKAKAAKREAATKATSTDDDNPNNPRQAFHHANDDYEIVNGPKTLQQRIRNAVSSGYLNIAALGLQEFPEEIARMYDFDPDSKVSWSEAVDLTKLIAADNKLKELPEFQFPDWSLEEMQDDEAKNNQFGGLINLDVRGNLLTHLPIGLRRLERLHVLTLSNNNLDIDALDIISQMTHLKELNLANNKLAGPLPSSLGDLIELQVLDLRGNMLSTLPHNIASLDQLHKLDISANKLDNATLPVLKELRLTDLNISHNALSGSLFQDGYVNPKLQTLDLRSNQFISLCGDNATLELPNLQTLACDNNRLQRLPNLQSLQSLTILTASDNKLEDLPDTFLNLEDLHSVDLSRNSIKSLDPRIANMEQLTNFDVSANPLRDRKYLAMSTDSLKAELAKRLVATDQGEHGTSHSDRGDVATQGGLVSSDKAGKKHTVENGVLNLSSEGLKTVDLSTLDLNQEVRTIRLSNNSLAEFPMDLLSHDQVKNSLKSLDLSHNQSLHPTNYLAAPMSLPALRSLYVVSTGLTSLETLLSYLSAPALTELNISCHRLTGPVPRVRLQFPSLTTLLATDNWFSSIEVENIRGLEVLDVSNNDIDHLPPKIGELGNMDGQRPAPGRLRAFECSGNRFRVPRLTVVEKGTEAILRDLRRMIPTDQVGAEWA